MGRYIASGESNFQVPDPAATIDTVAAFYVDTPGAQLDRLDGLTVTVGARRFNRRPSYTEPMQRLDVEAPDTSTMTNLRDKVLAHVRRA